MPWSQRDRPSAALAALTAYVRRERPGHRVDSCSAFLDVAAALGIDLYTALEGDFSVSELLYTPLLYPERRDAVRASFVAWAAEELGARAVFADRDWSATFEEILTAIEEHVTRLAAELAAGYDMVGMTTSFGQLFANLALAQEIKRRAPETTIVLGGSSVSSRVGPSLLAEYPAIDCIIQGEGEQPLVAVLDALAEGEPVPLVGGVLSRALRGPTPKGVGLWEVPRLDALPLPNYDEYAEKAAASGLEWAFTLEASRGCWWDRTKRTGDARSTCYFCNLNVQWGPYREKSPERIADEVAELTRRYKNLRLYFVDNIARARGFEAFAEALRGLRMDLDVFLEFRANATPWEVLLAWEAGVRMAQFGIEALSTPLLQRIGKGTTTIQNLQAMRLCMELRIRNYANLIVDFPGTTDAEIAESCEVIEKYALGFEPTTISRFQLGVDSTVDALQSEFAITNVRNAEKYRTGLPPDVEARLSLFDLDYDCGVPVGDARPLREVCERWRALHREHGGRPLLVYRDGGTFLTVEDEREDFSTGTFEGLSREAYLYCMQIRSLAALRKRFGAHPEADRLEAVLDELVGWRIMFREGDRFLALAVATEPAIAARRIRAAHADDRCEAQRMPANPRLRVPIDARRRLPTLDA